MTAKDVAWANESHPNLAIPKSAEADFDDVAAGFNRREGWAGEEQDDFRATLTRHPPVETGGYIVGARLCGLGLVRIGDRISSP